MTAGQFHTCGETTTNEAYCWGENGRGGLGDGTTISRLTPVAVTGGLRFSQLGAGGLYTCGVASDTGAYCWGFNSNGALGDGTREDRSVPTSVRWEEEMW